MGRWGICFFFFLSEFIRTLENSIATVEEIVWADMLIGDGS